MALLPDMRRVIFTEQNVDIPACTKAGSACDLGLCFEQGKDDRAVLVVTEMFNFKFVDGTSSTDPAVKLAWTPDGALGRIGDD